MSYLDNIIKVYGPYTRKDKRQVVVITLNDGSKLTKSYPKYLKELELGRELDVNLETIDHVNRDFTDSSEDNIQILSRAENAAKSALRRSDVYDNCVWCGKHFKLSNSQIKNRCRGKAGPFCSRSCSGKYGKEVQRGGELLPPIDITVNYYRLDD
ncbi:hypothetical protein EPNKCIFM_00049 [Klebsiella phage KP13-16]|nr:hypothetical protein EPNKCIFM_00049 [Klebsiella phage KP13-16]